MQDNGSSELPADISTEVADIEATKRVCVCFIPARKHSRRLKNKSKALLKGKPLVQYAIEVAKKSGIFQDIIVTSDDMEILELAYRMKVMPHRRPRRLAMATVQYKYVCRLLLGLLRPVTEFCVLLPTNPLRTVEDIKKAYDLFKKTNANYLMSVVKATPPPQWALHKEKGYLKPYYPDKVETLRQNLEPLFYHDGSIIFAKVEAFLTEFDKGFYGSKVIPFEAERSIDIDTEEDLEYAKFLMRKRSESSNTST